MAVLNYAAQYSQALAQAFPYVLNFGDLYATPNNGRYKVSGAKTIEIPVISTTGRVDGEPRVRGAGSGAAAGAAVPGRTARLAVSGAVRAAIDHEGHDDMKRRFDGKVALITGASSGIGRLVTVDEVANAVLWLCSKESTATTGIAFPVDGGLTVP